MSPPILKSPQFQISFPLIGNKVNEIEISKLDLTWKDLQGLFWFEEDGE